MKSIRFKSALILIGVSIIVIGGADLVSAAKPTVTIDSTIPTTVTVTVNPTVILPNSGNIPTPTATVTATVSPR